MRRLLSKDCTAALADGLFQDRPPGSELSAYDPNNDHIVSSLDGFAPCIWQLAPFLAITPNVTYSLKVPFIELWNVKDIDNWIQLVAHHPDI